MLAGGEQREPQPQPMPQPHFAQQVGGMVALLYRRHVIQAHAAEVTRDDRFVGRELDPAAEAAYIDALRAEFVAGGRRLQPFLRHLFTQSEFRRGL